jgi:adenylosuccinate synthase
MPQVFEVYVGGYWGDEGKGKLVGEAAARAAQFGGRVIIVRFQGGSNAGHTQYVHRGDEILKMVTHSASSGLTGGYDIGIAAQSAFNPTQFLAELHEGIARFGYKGRVMISERTGVLLDYHMKLDAWLESIGEKKIGTTKSGMGPFYMDKANRRTEITMAQYVSDDFPKRLEEVLKLKDLELSAAGILKPGYLDELVAQHEQARKELAPFVERLEYRLREYLDNGDHIIVEGGQGSLLDVDMGTKPDITPSHLLADHAFPAIGLPRTRSKVYVVEKAYPTRVGEGIMPTLDKLGFGNHVDTHADEFGATTGRKRRAGYPDWVAAKRSAVLLNSCDGIFITRFDVIQDIPIKVCVAYEYGGKVVAEMPLDLSGVNPVYSDKVYQWHLWDGPKDLSKPMEVDSQLRKIRADIVNAGWHALDKGALEYASDHDKYFGVPIVGISIGPSQGETVLRKGFFAGAGK